jgi:hypothetical protein
VEAELADSAAVAVVDFTEAEEDMAAATAVKRN